MEITELICILNVVISAAFAITFPGYSIIFPSAVRLTLIGSSLSDFTSTTMRDYVNMRPTGILLHATKRIVFVPFSIFLEIRLHVVHIPLTIRFSRGVLFIFLLIALDICNVVFTLCLGK